MTNVRIFANVIIIRSYVTALKKHVKKYLILQYKKQKKKEELLMDKSEIIKEMKAINDHIDEAGSLLNKAFHKLHKITVELAESKEEKEE